MITEPILKGSVVAVDALANLPADQIHLRGRFGAVTQDSQPGTVVMVNFYEVAGTRLASPRKGKTPGTIKIYKTEQLHRDVLSIFLDRLDPKWNSKKVTNKVHSTSPDFRRNASARLIARQAERCPYTPEQEAAIVEMAKTTSLSYHQIAAKFGLSYSCVANMASKAGIVRNGPCASPRITKEKKKEVVATLRRLVERGEYGRGSGSMYQRAAEICGVTFNVANNIAAEFNIVTGMWTADRKQAILAEIRDLVPSLPDADLVKLLEGNAGLMASIRFNHGNGTISVAAALRAVRSGALQVGPEDGDEDDETPPKPPVINIHVADRAAAAGATKEVVEYLIESQMCLLRAEWFRTGVVPVV